MTGGHVVVITSNAEFEEQIKAAKAAGKKVVVKFTATWCGPCHMIAPEFVKLSDEYGGIVFLEVDVDEVEEVASACGISAMPTFHVYKDVGEKADELVGANKDKLVEMIKAHVSEGST